jgi:hypothetical protein
MASKVSSIHLPYHNVNKFVLIVSNFPRAKFSQHRPVKSEEGEEAGDVFWVALLASGFRVFTPGLV